MSKSNVRRMHFVLIADVDEREGVELALAMKALTMALSDCGIPGEIIAAVYGEGKTEPDKTAYARRMRFGADWPTNRATSWPS